MRNRTIIRLTENDLNGLIAETATRMLNELDTKTMYMAAKKALDKSREFGSGEDGDEAPKASKAAVRKVTKMLAKNEAFLNLPPDRKLDVIKQYLANYYYGKAMGMAGRASYLDNPTQSGWQTPDIDKIAKDILRDYFYDSEEGKWKENEVDMPEFDGVDLSSLYDEP